MTHCWINGEVSAAIYGRKWSCEDKRIRDFLQDNTDYFLSLELYQPDSEATAIEMLQEELADQDFPDDGEMPLVWSLVVIDKTAEPSPLEGEVY